MQESENHGWIPKKGLQNYPHLKEWAHKSISLVVVPDSRTKIFGNKLLIKVLQNNWVWSTACLESLFQLSSSILVIHYIPHSFDACFSIKFWMTSIDSWMNPIYEIDIQQNSDPKLNSYTFQILFAEITLECLL